MVITARPCFKHGIEHMPPGNNKSGFIGRRSSCLSSGEMLSHLKSYAFIKPRDIILAPRGIKSSRQWRWRRRVMSWRDIAGHHLHKLRCHRLYRHREHHHRPRRRYGVIIVMVTVDAARLLPPTMSKSAAHGDVPSVRRPLLPLTFFTRRRPAD